MRSEVQIFPDPPLFGAIAQLGERLPCTQEVGGSIPPGSTNFARTLLQRMQKFVESCDGSMLLFNNLEISDVLSGSTLIQDFLVELIQSSVAFAHVA